MFIFGRTNGTLELHTFITALPKNFTFSVRSTLGNSTATAWWCSFFLRPPLPPSPIADGPLDIFSFSNFQRGLRSVRFEDSR